MVETYRYYARRAGRHTAERFFARAEETFQTLAAFPTAGAVYNPDKPKLAGLRYLRINKFPNQTVFYKPLADGDGIEVYRVLHGARDVESMLDEEFE